VTGGKQETAYPGLERRAYEKLCMEQVLATKTNRCGVQPAYVLAGNVLVQSRSRYRGC
jgi:hypothetical protein